MYHSFLLTIGVRPFLFTAASVLLPRDMILRSLSRSSLGSLLPSVATVTLLIDGRLAVRRSCFSVGRVCRIPASICSVLSGLWELNVAVGTWCQKDFIFGWRGARGRVHGKTPRAKQPFTEPSSKGRFWGIFSTEGREKVLYNLNLTTVVVSYVHLPPFLSPFRF